MVMSVMFNWVINGLVKTSGGISPPPPPQTPQSAEQVEQVSVPLQVPSPQEMTATAVRPLKEEPWRVS